MDEKTVNHFEAQLDEFIEKHRSWWVEHYEGLLSDPLMEVWFEKFGVNDGIQTLQEFMPMYYHQCQSPIERILLLAIKTYADECGEIHGYECSNSCTYKEDTLRKGPPTDWNDLVIEAQVPIGKYKIDFRFTYREQIDFSPTKNWFSKTVLVECDGHEFHETKAAAAKDKKRDRFLAAEGYSILRFTGSEIWKDPFKCAEDIINYLQKDSKSGKMRLRDKQEAIKASIEFAAKEKLPPMLGPKTEIDDFIDSLIN